MPLTIPVGGRLFQPMDLDHYVAAAIPAIPAGHTCAAVAAVDVNGAKVAVSIASRDGHWNIEGAYAHDWNGGTMAAGQVLVSW